MMALKRFMRNISSSTNIEVPIGLQEKETARIFRFVEYEAFKTYSSLFNRRPVLNKHPGGKFAKIQ